MALSKDFNPRGVLVARKSGGLALGGRQYEQGEVIPDDCISLRKSMQLYKQNHVCHPHELAPQALPNTDQRSEEQKAADDAAQAKKDAEAKEKEAAESEDVKPEAGNGDDSDASVATESDTQESEGEASSEPEKEVAKPARRRRAKNKSKE